MSYCSSETCKKKYHCKRHIFNLPSGLYQTCDYSSMASGSSEGKFEYYCGEKGNYKLLEKIKFYKEIKMNKTTSGCGSCFFNSNGECSYGYPCTGNLKYDNQSKKFVPLSYWDPQAETIKQTGTPTVPNGGNPLAETYLLMVSKDYKERFLAEYLQLKIRYQKLHQTVVKAKAGTLGFKLSCPLALLERQERAMLSYLTALEIRAEVEKIEVTQG